MMYDVPTWWIVICLGFLVSSFLVSATMEDVTSKSKTLPCLLPQLLVSGTYAERQDTHKHTHTHTHTLRQTYTHRCTHTQIYTLRTASSLNTIIWVYWFVVKNVLNDHCFALTWLVTFHILLRHKHTCADTQTHTHVQTHRHTHRHTDTHTDTHTHRHTHSRH